MEGEFLSWVLSHDTVLKGLLILMAPDGDPDIEKKGCGAGAALRARGLQRTQLVWYGEYGEYGQGEQTPGGGEAAARSMILHVQRTGLWLEATMWRRVWELAVS